MNELYHDRVLELASDMPHVGRLAPSENGAAFGTATKVSRVCGSVVTVDLALEHDRIVAFAIDPQACALGQASAGVLALNAIGTSGDQLIAARDGLRAMLKEGAAPPAGRFWELRHLEGVRDYPARHASTLLAFDAAVAAYEAAAQPPPSPSG